MADTITLALNIAFGVFIFFGVFWGLIRGFRKTFGRLLFLMLTCVILIFVTQFFTSLILMIPVKLTIETASGVTTESMRLQEYLVFMTKDFLGEQFVTSNPGFADAICTLPIVAINSILYLVLFWAFKYLLYFLNMLLVKLTIPRRKREAMAFADLGGNDENDNVGMFIKKEDEIAKSAPSASAQNLPTPPADEIDEGKKRKKKKEKKPKAEKVKLTKAEKKEQKKADKLARKKQKKYRLLGALTGVFVGFVVMFSTFIPIYGYMDILSSHKGLELRNLSETPISLSEMGITYIDDVVKGYDLSIIGRMSQALGLEKLGFVGFDTVTTRTVGDNKVVLRKDIDALCESLQLADGMAGKIKNISSREGGFSTITESEITSIISDAQNLIEKCKQVKSVNLLGGYVIPALANYITINNIKLSENQTLNNSILELLSILGSSNDINIFNEAGALIDLAKYLNEQHLLYLVISQDFSDPLGIIHGLDDDFAEQFKTKLFNVKTIDYVLPQALNIGLDMVKDMISSNNNFEISHTDKEQLKTAINDIISHAFDTVKSLSKDSSILVTDKTLEPTGLLLNKIKDFVTKQTYDDVLNYAVNKIKTLVNQIVPSSLVDFVNNRFLANVTDVTDWQYEMKCLSDTIAILRDVDNGFLGTVSEGATERTGFSIDFKVTEGVLNNLGVALDTLEQGTLFGHKTSVSLIDPDGINKNHDVSTMVTVFTTLLDQLSPDTEDSLLPSIDILGDMGDTIKTMKENLILSNHIYTPSEDKTETNGFWANELKQISPLITYVYGLKDGGELSIDEELGRCLDTASNSVMLGGKTTLKLVGNLMDMVTDSVLGEGYEKKNDGSIEDQIFDLMGGIKTNLNSPETADALKNDGQFWTKEIRCMTSLQNLAEKADSISTISQVQELAPDLDVIMESRIIPTTQFNSTISTVLKELKSDESTGVNGKINQLIDDIASDIVNPAFFSDKVKTNFWSIEIEKISALNDIDFGDSPEHPLKDSLPVIGKTLDEIVFGGTDASGNQIRGSYLITANRIRSILSTAINETVSDLADSFDEKIKNTITKALTDIAKNIYDEAQHEQTVQITSFEFELKHISALANLDIPNNIFNYPSGDGDKTEALNKLKADLEKLGASFDVIAYNTKTESGVIKFDEDKNSKVITRTIISDIMSGAFTSLGKIESPSSDIDNLFNKMIDDIAGSIKTINSHDQVITYARELQYISSLITLNSGTEFTLENASTEVGKNLDAIAFKHDDAKFKDVQYNGQYQIVGDYSADNLNSVVITRTILSDGMGSLLETFKTKTSATNSVSQSYSTTAQTKEELSEEDKLANELIDNLKTKISTNTLCTDGSCYNDYESAFRELNEVKEELDNLSNQVNGKQLSEIDDDLAKQIDSTLESMQSKIVCGVLTTRKIAKLMADKINDTMSKISLFASTDCGKFLTSLIEHYQNNITNSTETKELYSADGSHSDNEFANPFATLKSKFTISGLTPSL